MSANALDEQAPIASTTDVARSARPRLAITASRQPDAIS
jgi:hypothetical protein